MTLILQMETLRYRQVQQLTYSYTFSKRQSWRRKPGSLVPERVVFTRTVHCCLSETQKVTQQNGSSCPVLINVGI